MIEKEKKIYFLFNLIGIFVKDIKKSEKYLAPFLKLNKKKICYEVVQEPCEKNNPVGGFIKRGPNFLNHKAYSTKNFSLAIVCLKKINYTQISGINYSKFFAGKDFFS